MKTHRQMVLITQLRKKFGTLLTHTQSKRSHNNRQNGIKNDIITQTNLRLNTTQQKAAMSMKKVDITVLKMNTTFISFANSYLFYGKTFSN